MSLCITFFTASEISETGSKWNQKPSEAERSGIHFLSGFGVMSSERFQLNLLRHLFGFSIPYRPWHPDGMLCDGRLLACVVRV